MTRLNFTFQEASPMITYSPQGAWVEGSSSNDTLSADYTGSFRVSFTAGATASFSFAGTAVSIFGATRPNHGNYTVNIDQQPTFMGVGTSVNTFNKSLWHADNLGYTQHTVTLTDVPAASGAFVDLDFISIERQIGQAGDTIFNATLDDTSPSVQFKGSWQASTNVPTAFRGTHHATTTANSQAIVNFQGCCVELYGQYANALYSVVLDNQQPLKMQGLNVDLVANFQHPQTLLYLVDGLSEGNHTVTLTNLNSNENRPFFFDYAVASSVHPFNATTSSGSNPPPVAETSGGSGDSTPVGAIAGGAVGALIIVGLIVFVFLFLRRRRRRRAQAPFALDLMPDEPKPYVLPHHAASADEAYDRDSANARPLPPVPQGHNAPQSKFRPQAPIVSGYTGRNEDPSEEGLLSPQEQSEAGSSSYGRTTSTATSSTTTGSGTLASRSASTSRSTSRRGTKSRFSLSNRGGGESSQAPPVQEEDAGVVLDADDEAPAGRTLPPAYNPNWHRDPNPS